MIVRNWDLNKIRKKHVIKAAKIWDTNGYMNFKNSISYDVIINGRAYPPKAISSCAHHLATGVAVKTSEFSGAKDGRWHNMLAALGFTVIEKRPQMDFDAEVALVMKISAKKRAKLLAKMSSAPPMQVATTVYRYVRSPLVVVERLSLANGICEECKKPAPFNKKKGGAPYLEVHHIKPLSKGGLDVVENTKAVCPNCHCQIHDAMSLDLLSE